MTPGPNHPTHKIVSALALTALLVLAASDRLFAQDTRAGLIEQQQAEKAKAAAPYQPSGVERVLVRVEDALTGPRAGIYPFFDSVYSGGGFTLGAGFSRFYGDSTFWDVKGLLSLKAYKLIQVGTESHGHLQGRVNLYARTGWRDAPQVAYYGLGIDSTPDDKSNFQLQQGFATAGLQARPVPWTVFSAAASYEDFSTFSGHSSSSPSIEDIYSPATAPGLDAGPNYIHTTLTGGIDSRPAPDYARRGALYELQYHHYDDTAGAYSFDRLDAELIQHVPILRENWVLSFRGRMQTTLGDDEVPYFLMPALGSGSTLRAYSSWRFRDFHSLLTSAEFRWIPNRLGMDMALFYDAGKVTSSRSDLNFDGMQTDVGVGVRFHAPMATALRIELAHGREGFNLVFGAGSAF